MPKTSLHKETGKLTNTIANTQYSHYVRIPLGISGQFIRITNTLFLTDVWVTDLPLEAPALGYQLKNFPCSLFGISGFCENFQFYTPVSD